METKAARLHNYGGTDAIEVEDANIPEPNAGEVVIRVRDAGVNPIDWKIADGYLEDVLPVSFPFTLGTDVAGVVEATGPGVSELSKGDEVYGQAGVTAGGTGAFARFAVTTPKTLARKPTTIDFVKAASLPLAGVSALQALTEHLDLRAGQKILIHGGAGGIGSIAIQIAKNIGAEVATTCSKEDMDFVRDLGADKAIDYKAHKFEDILSSLDAVFDTVGGDTYERSFKVLKKGGQIVSMLESPRDDLVNQYGVTAMYQQTRVTTARLNRLTVLVDSGAIKTHVSKVYPLDEAAEALRELKENSPKGKVAIAVGGR